ncbi:hypothetical protein SH528x_003291 [Novipirellula sp. SH528]|uniref:hypothetical protein n=1 Tax=Novipirellula sp. SH528 TaxID=3454466 RepID=UPI003F9FB630
MEPANNPLWRQWEAEHPTFRLGEVNGRWKEPLAPFLHAGVLCPTIAAGDWWCDECCEAHEVRYHDFPSGRCGYVLCSYGSTRLPRDQTDQLKIDTATLLQKLFAGSRTKIHPIVGERLWSIGRHTIGSRSRELQFVRSIVPRHVDEIASQLVTHPKAILFTPTKGSAAFWQTRVPCVTIALEQVVSMSGSTHTVDWQAVEDLLGGQTRTDKEPRKQRQKRGTRTANIERLRDELKRHLYAAADHAVATAESDAGITLLPRPSKTQLAKLSGLSKSDVTRCFADPTANELRLLWQTADDLEAVLRLRGRSSLAK